MFEVEPIAYVRGGREAPDDDFWGDTRCVIELVDGIPSDALDGVEEFSHVEVVFLFHHVDPARLVTGARRPRNNPDWPLVGIFAQRGKNRPNRIGCSIVPLIARDGRSIVVGELDAINGTPVLDIKPVLSDYLPRTPVRQPEWSREIMRDYWSVAE